MVAFEHRMDRDQPVRFEDADLVGQGVHLDRRLSADCVEKLPFGDVRFSGRPMGVVFKKSGGGPANLSIGQRARSSTGLRWCWAAMFHRIAIWGVFVTLDFSTFSTQSAGSGHPAKRDWITALDPEQQCKQHRPLR